MEYLLFAAYLLFFCWLITRIGFFTKSGLSKAQLIILFLVKILGGIFYGWMGVYYGEVAKMLDTWNYHYEGLIEYKLLLSDPKLFFSQLVTSNYDHGYTRFFSSNNSFWNDLKANTFIKMIALFDVFSFGYYYINVIFYSFLTFFGPIAFYRVMKEKFPLKKTELIFSVFLIPSFVYWCSGLHKEGVLFTAISLLIYHTYYLSIEKKAILKRCLLILMSLILLLMFRNFVLVALLPAWGAWILSIIFPQKTKWIFATTVLLSILLFFTARYVFPALDFPAAIVEKQQSFISLSGRTSVPINELEPTAISFLINLPQSFSLAALRPYASDVIHLPSMAAALETMLFWILLGICIVFYQKQPSANKPLIYFLLFFIITLLLSVGYTVNNLGAIVRYRSIVIPFAISLLVIFTNYKMFSDRILKFISKNNNV